MFSQRERKFSCPVFGPWCENQSPNPNLALCDLGRVFCCCCCYKFIYLFACLSARVTERETQKKREAFICWFTPPNGHYIQGWTRLKPEQLLPGLLWVSGAPALEPSSAASPSCINRKLDQKPICWDMTRHHVGCQRCRWRLSPLCHSTGSQPCVFTKRSMGPVTVSFLRFRFLVKRRECLYV